MQTQTNTAAPADLRSNHLSAVEALGQSLATVAPTAAPAFIIPIMLGGSGNGTWLAFLFATVAIICIGREINAFARRTSSPGSLYAFVAEALPRASVPAAWSLLFAYLGTGIACVCGGAVYAYSLLLPNMAITRGGALLFTALFVTLATMLAWFDVRFSTRLMLGIEAFSIASIFLLFLLPGHGSALHLDRAQLLLSGVTLHQIRGGLVLGVFAFVGFESAASLGGEAMDPLRTIPRAISLTIVLCGLWFVFSAYAETIAFAGRPSTSETVAPLKLLADLRGCPAFSHILGVTTLISAFAGLVACIQASARTLYRMGRDGQCARILGRAHARRQSPHIALLASAVVNVILPAVLLFRGYQVLQIYGWLATLATFGFLTAYALVAIASARLQLRARTFGFLSAVSFVIIACVVVLGVSSSFDPSVTGLDRLLPGIYLVALAACVVLTVLLRKPQPQTA